ncbi:MAG: hypothetical protein K0B09_13835 [Bacteroidales bacterium]|nr:hypothetical protein [Bacteroidales bacterium]
MSIQFKNYKYLRSIFFGLLIMVSAAGMFLTSCQRPAPLSGEQAVARVNNAFLYKSDLKHLLPVNTSPADSALIVQRYVENWVRQQVFLNEALRNLSSENMNFERQIEEYRNSLIIFSYENHLVEQQLDTLVTEKQLAEYYEKNKADFRLRNNIVKVNYVKLPLDAPDLAQFRRLFRSADPEETGLLEDYCMQNAATYFIDSDTWLIFGELLRELPLQVSSAENYLRSNRFVELSDNHFRYFINFIDYQLVGSVSPLAFERDNIKSIILNRRKHELINQKRNQFYQEALSGNQVEIFSN